MALSIYDYTVRHRQYGNVGFGNTLQVDAVLGDDSKGGINQSPFKTINGAIAKAVSGSLILIAPGTYTEIINLPSGVSMSGYNPATTIVTFNATANTDLLTLNSNSIVENLTFNLTSSGHFQLRAVVFTGTAAATCKMVITVVSVDNSSASISGTSNVYAIHSNGTSSSNAGFQAFIVSTATCTSTGLGNKRALLCDTGSQVFSTRACNFICSGTGTGSFIGVETNNSGANALLRLGRASGTSADISSTAGQVQVNACILQNSNANGLPVYPVQIAQLLIFADPGSLQAGAKLYMRPGTATSSTTVVYVMIPQNAICRAISIQSITGPGSTRTDTFTVYKNNVATSVTSSLTGSATSNYYQASSVGFVSGDKLSVVANTAPGTTTTDVVVSVEII